MKKVLVGIFILCLIIFFTGCATTEQSNSTDSNPQPQENKASSQDSELTPDAEYQDAVKSLDKIFASGEKYKCELIKNEGDASSKQILFIDGENYKAEGFSHPKVQEIYNNLGDVTSNVVALKQDNGEFCTYVWSVAVNKEGTKKEQGTKGCMKDYKPAKPFEINDLFVGVFEGVTPELIGKCVKFEGNVDYSIPSDQEFLDFAEMNLENA